MKEGTEYLEVAAHEVPLVAAVAGVRAHLLRDERGEPGQHLLVLPHRRATCTSIPTPPHERGSHQYSTQPNTHH